MRFMFWDKRSKHIHRAIGTFLWLGICAASAMSPSTSNSASSSIKRILVTGGNKGIGKSICERLLSEWNDTYVILGSRSLERGQQALRDIARKLKCDGRIQCIQLDTSSDESVEAAANELSDQPPLYGIINNAGIGWGYSVEETVNVNYFGPRRVNDKMGSLIRRPGGRIVNVASASGPNFVSSLKDKPLAERLQKPWLFAGGIADIDSLARSDAILKTDNAYGASKALLNAYTALFAKANPDLVVNSCTPGWIATDLTKGTGATNTPEQGAIPPCTLLMDESFASKPSGRYYGSDCVRSPLHYYRGPGDEPYVDDEDIRN